MIISRDEIKELTGLAGTAEFDGYIDRNIPTAVEYLFDETKNYFEVLKDQISLSASTISFDQANRKIIDSENGFLDAGFKSGMNFRVHGSLLNDGVKLIKQITASEIIVDIADTIVNENFELDVRLTVVKIPETVKLFLARLIDHFKPSKAKTQGITQERFDDYSVTFSKTTEIPEEIFQLLDPYRKLEWD